MEFGSFRADWVESTTARRYSDISLPRLPCLQGVAGVYFFGRGLFWKRMPNRRVVVYIDYQNVYHGARELFSGSQWSPPSTGNVYPLAIKWGH